MGFLDSLKEQFIDVIEYTDPDNKIIVYKYVRPGNEIKQGARVIVREGQLAIFIKEGKLADILGPGTHVLNTKNLPILSTLAALPFGFNSPIKSDLYFVSMKQFIDNKWATKNPILTRDTDFNMARIKAFGKYSFRINNIVKFMNEVFGTRQKVLTYDIIEYLASIITEIVAEIITNSNLSALDLAMKYRELSNEIFKLANQQAMQLGISFTGIVIENISLPEEVEKMIDEQSGIGMASKNMSTFMQYQTARAMRDAAKQKGGLAGLGAGMALGNTMAKTVNKTTSDINKSSKDTINELRELKQLVDEGILTQEEFEAKKKQILGI